jgi:hypothetical protein
MVSERQRGRPEQQLAQHVTALGWRGWGQDGVLGRGGSRGVGVHMFGAVRGPAAACSVKWHARCSHLPSSR